MKILLYTRDFGMRGGGAKSSISTFNYLKENHSIERVGDIKDLLISIAGWNPDLILHHNIIDLEKAVKVANKNKIPIIVTVNGLFTCAKGTHIKGQGFGDKNTICNLWCYITCAIKGQEGFRYNPFKKILFLLSSYYRFRKKQKRIIALNNSQYIIVIGQSLKNILQQNGVTTDIKVIPQPIEITDNISDNHSNKEYNRNSDVLEQFYKSKNKKIILGTGLDPTKGALVFLRAFKKLNRDDSEIYVIGRIYDIDMNKYKALLKNVYFTGKLTPPEIYQMMKHATFFAHPNLLIEPFGRMWAESLLVGCPVLALHGRGGPSDYLTHLKTAYLTDPDEISLSKGISKLLDDSKLRSYISKNGQNFARNSFIPDIVINNLEKVYKDVLEGNRYGN